LSRAAALAVAAVALISALGTIGSALAPWLLVRHPLALILLSPDVRHLVLVAPQVDFAPVLAAGLVRRAAGIGAMYALGRQFGPLVIPWIERQAPRIGRALVGLERAFARVGPSLLVVFPFYALGALAGAAGTRVKVFLPATLAGQTLYITTSYYFGDAIALWTGPLIAFLGNNLLASTLVCTAIVGVQQVWSRRRARGAGTSPREERS